MLLTDRRVIAKALDNLRYDRLPYPLLIKSPDLDIPQFEFTPSMERMRSDYLMDTLDGFDFENLSIKSDETPLPPWNPRGGLVDLGGGFVGMSTGGDKCELPNHLTEITTKLALQICALVRD